MNAQPLNPEPPSPAAVLLWPCEAAEILGVSQETVRRWADRGWLTCLRTPTRRRRYLEHEVRALASEGPWMYPREVAALLRVKPYTVTRWAAAGKLTCDVMPSGHRRYLKADIMAVLNETGKGS